MNLVRKSTLAFRTIVFTSLFCSFISIAAVKTNASTEISVNAVSIENQSSSTPVDNSPASTALQKYFAIIAHRGASGYLPEHTLASTALAFAQGPDFIEQDVVITKDNKPVVLHDIHLETVTNVEHVFPSRNRDDGRFYARDFTLNELKQLRVHERADSSGKQVFAERYQGQVAHFTIATLDEHFELIRELNRELDKNIGVYPEVKSPKFHLDEGVDASAIVIDTLNKYGFSGPDGNSFLQCFDFNEVKRIRNQLAYKGKLVMLIGENEWSESDTDYNWIRSKEGMDTVAEYADGIGPWLGQLLDKTALDTGNIKAASWLEHAHTNALTIHPYTFRQDALLGGMTQTQLLDTLKHVIKVDGVFTDHTPAVVKWRNTQP
jgi:glycerophosphoryl diester phosphodiesterase